MSRPPDPAALARPWISGYPPGVPPTYELPAVGLWRLLEDAARDFPEREALVADGRRLDYATLRARVERLAVALATAGVAPDDRVGVALPGHAVAPAVLLACWRLGAVAVPLPHDAPLGALAEVLVDAGATALVGSPQALGRLAARPDLQPPVLVQVAGDELDRRGRWRPRRRRRPAVAGARHLGALMAEAAGDALPEPPGPERLAMLAYRAGAEEPRGAMLTHAALGANAFQARLWVPDIQAGRERLLLAEPLWDLAAITLGLNVAVLSAAALVVCDDPSPGELAATIEAERPTLLPTRPARLAALAADASAARRDLSSLRVCVAGKEHLDPRVAADVERLTGGARVREGFGLLEAGPLTHAQPVYGRAVQDAMGLPVTDTVAVAVDPEDLGRIVPSGQPGRLLVSGPQLMAGYWHRDAETAAALVDGWLVTDDVVSVDPDGVFHHLGRRDEVLERDGATVSLPRVEAVLRRHTRVADAAVGADGDALVARVVPEDRRRPPAADDLAAHARVHLETAEVPDRFAIVERVPHDGRGRIDRAALAQQPSPERSSP